MGACGKLFSCSPPFPVSHPPPSVPLVSIQTCWPTKVHCGISKSRKPLNINMACWSFCFHLILFGLAKSCGETPVRPGKVAMNYWLLTASSKHPAVHFSVFLSFYYYFFLKTCWILQRVDNGAFVSFKLVLQIGTSMWTSGKKKENLDVQVLTRLAQEHKQTEGWRCVCVTAYFAGTYTRL